MFFTGVQLAVFLKLLTGDIETGLRLIGFLEDSLVPEVG